MKETHFRSVDQLLSQKPIRELSESFSDNIRTNLARLIPLYDKNVLINRKLCMLRTLIENDVSEVPWDILFERSKNLKNDACSLEGLILKYGESVGRKLFSVRGEAVAVTKESYTKNHTEAEWLELCERKKSNLGESGYIEKFGEVEGRCRWNEYLAKWTVGIQKRKASGIWKNGLTLEEFQNKWGMEEGYNRWKSRINQRTHTLSLEGFVDRFGQEIGTEEYYAHVDKMVCNCRKRAGGYSKISQQLFDSIYEQLPIKLKSHVKYFTRGGEEKFYINESDTDMRIMFIDFKCGNAIIEFDGDYWHSFPETIKRDKIKNHILESRGYALLRIREADYTSNKEAVTQNCINFILNNYERAQS